MALEKSELIKLAKTVANANPLQRLLTHSEKTTSVTLI
jgi:hypothetical protein